MTSIEAAIAQIERDRRTREEGLLLFLLALTRRARRQVNAALRTGGSWLSMLRDTLLGREALDLPGGVDVLARGMADSHIAGYERVGKLIDVEMPPYDATPGRTGVLEALAIDYATQAREALERTADGLQMHVGRALSEAEEADSIAADLRAVRVGFGAAGLTPDKPRTAQAEATAAVTRAYSAGMMQGYDAPPVAGAITGLRYVAVRDEKTTTICRTFDGVKLPVGHWWFQTRTPPNHWNCRSLLLPIRGVFVPTPENELPLYPEPMQGFGFRPGQRVTINAY